MNRKYALISTPLALLASAALIFQTGCAGPAASKTVKGATVGGGVGAVGGLIAGEDAGGIAAAGAAGAVVGTVIGAVAQSRENKRQDTLAQQRAYNQAIAMQKRAQEKEKSQLQEELEIAEGFRITAEELDEMTSRAESAEERLAILQKKRDAAIERKRELDELEQREREALAEAARLEKELAELEGGTTTAYKKTTEEPAEPQL
ncbi:hypothetical protein [Pelagicoccus sp. SDUM812005]|uniref:hypothetical protein n=1 Tax=Pelagicoccus sp. SDUM812005 TaxID=3041257 RepID=UPI00280CEB13|nr:hypothetical protein [Pelagicoccus sp. SDUM812005]MDQ8180199.1 hypothetical protein [Pelagicoccus sp. SDUM812005]